MLTKGVGGPSTGVSEPPQAASSPVALTDEADPGSPTAGRTARPSGSGGLPRNGGFNTPKPRRTHKNQRGKTEAPIKYSSTDRAH